MIRRSVCAALLLVLVAALSGTGHAAVPPGYSPRGLGDTYLALGDSLATGTEEAGNNDNLPGYPETLFGYLQQINPDLTMRKLGRDGETSTSMITGTTMISSQLDLAVAFILSERAAGRRVGLVTLDIGGNDLIDVLFAGDPDAAVAKFRGNLAIILDRLLAALTLGNVRQGDLVLMDYYNPYPGLDVPGRGKLPDIYVPQLNTIIKEAAASRGLPVAEAAQAFAGKEAAYIYVQRPNGGYPPINPLDPALRTKFDYHPRPAGHKAIANSFAMVSGYRLNIYTIYMPVVLRQ